MPARPNEGQEVALGSHEGAASDRDGLRPGSVVTRLNPPLRRSTDEEPGIPSSTSPWPDADGTGQVQPINIPASTSSPTEASWGSASRLIRQDERDGDEVKRGRDPHAGRWPAFG